MIRHWGGQCLLLNVPYSRHVKEFKKKISKLNPWKRQQKHNLKIERKKNESSWVRVDEQTLWILKKKKISTQVIINYTLKKWANNQFWIFIISKDDYDFLPVFNHYQHLLPSNNQTWILFFFIRFVFFCFWKNFEKLLRKK